jgi:septum formation protein
VRLILGSQSPRRREILSFFSLPFEQVSAHFDEESVPFEGDPVKYAKTLSEGKANSLMNRFPNAVILTADTVVFKEGKIFNKPANEEENFAILQELNGSWHSVFTSITTTYDSLKITECDETRVQFHKLNETQLQSYHKAFQGNDKAGGYGIQEAGSIIVKRIEGCFYNVMGLPLNALQKVLKPVGIDLWQYLPS